MREQASDQNEAKTTFMPPLGGRDQLTTNSLVPGHEVSPIIHEVLHSTGQPLDAQTRAFMGSRFEYDFSRVRIHSDDYAAKSAQAVNAQAYTVGSDIVFGANRYSPGVPRGQRLLAHELAHVVQQDGIQRNALGKLKTGDPSDKAEQAADQATKNFTIPASDNSVALDIRSQLRDSRVTSPIIQLAVPTWGGEYDTDKYELTKDPGLDGVEIELRFKPNKHADAELIGMTQMALTREKGLPFAIGAGKEKKALESRMIPNKEAGAGAMIDRLPSKEFPLYGTDAPAKGGSLAGGVPTKTTQHGYHYTDKAGKLHKLDALLKDKPQLFSARKESSQVFESTALAVKGVQEGTFYGSVQWGWEKDAAGKVKKLPLTLVSKDVPSSVFARASELWNKAKTSKGKETIDLPIVTGKYTNILGVWLVSNPSQYKATIIGNLEKNTRLEVTNKGTAEPFNKTAVKWWKVTVVDGTHIGKVGWVMQTFLSDAQTK